jgi:hypothetical protein
MFACDNIVSPSVDLPCRIRVGNADSEVAMLLTLTVAVKLLQ